MKHLILATLAVLFAWLGLAAGPVAAQNTYPFQAPNFSPGWQTPLSPYLNMLLPGNTAINYFALTQPQFQQRQYQNQTNMTIQGILGQIQPPPGITDEELNAYLSLPLRSTGHPTAINYTGSYFSTLMGYPYTGEGMMLRRMGMGGGMMGAGGRSMGMGGMGMGMGGMGMGGMGMGGMGMGGMGMGMGMGGMGSMRSPGGMFGR
jgi:hypothetical protein